mmetsp:Transcript_5660/g.14699  ORF Transcript_5660/g.14699 Transcript_5660/m.14699 type:complete len:280 (+) Transcript_5660:307-1146(+)
MELLGRDVVDVRCGVLCGEVVGRQRDGGGCRRCKTDELDACALRRAVVDDASDDLLAVCRQLRRRAQRLDDVLAHKADRIRPGLKPGRDVIADHAHVAVAVAGVDGKVDASDLHLLRGLQAACSALLGHGRGATVLCARAREAFALHDVPAGRWTARGANRRVDGVRLPRVGDHRVHMARRLQPGHVGQEKADCLIKLVKVTRAAVAEAGGAGQHARIARGEKGVEVCRLVKSAAVVVRASVRLEVDGSIVGEATLGVPREERARRVERSAGADVQVRH